MLHPKFIAVENYSAALLCLDSIFAPTLPPKGTPTADPGPELSFHFAYFELLDRLRREDHFGADSVRRKLFAFQPRQDDNFLIPAKSPLYTAFVSNPETVQEKGGCVVTHEELRRVLDRQIPEYIHLRGKQQNKAYRWRLGTFPCLTMVARGECSRTGCQFQHLRPGQITVDWFNSRVRLVLKEIQILNLAGFHPSRVVQWVLHSPGPYQMLTLYEQALGWCPLLHSAPPVTETRIYRNT